MILILQLLFTTTIMGSLSFILNQAAVYSFMRSISEKKKYIIFLLTSVPFILPVGYFLNHLFFSLTSVEIPPIAFIAVDAEYASEIYSSLPGLSLAAVILLIWSGGITFQIGYRIFFGLSFKHYLKKKCFACTNPRLLTILDAEKAKLNIHSEISLFIIEAATIPFISKKRQYTIFLPEALTACPDDELSLVIRHELLHYKNMDLLLRRLIDIVIVIHWFNPFVYWFSRTISELAETACDERLVADLDSKQRKTYGESLIRISGSHLYQRQLFALSAKSRKLKTRLAKIAGNFPASKKMRFSGYAVYAVMVFAFFGLSCFVQGVSRHLELPETMPEYNTGVKVFLQAATISDEPENADDNDVPRNDAGVKRPPETKRKEQPANHDKTISNSKSGSGKKSNDSPPVIIDFEPYTFSNPYGNPAAPGTRNSTPKRVADEVDVPGEKQDIKVK